MAPKVSAGSKRAAPKGPAEERPAKKAFDLLQQRGISRAKYNAVVDALEHAVTKAAMNEDCRKMLAAMIPQGLCVPADQRHAHQAMAVKMIGEVLSKVEAELREAVTAEAEKVACAETSKADLVAKLGEAEVAVVEAGDVVKARTGILAELSKAMLSAKTALSDMQKEQGQGDMDYLAAKAEHETCQAALEGDFRRLRDGEWEEGQAKNHYGVLAALLGKLGLDESLASALPSSLMKKPGDRGVFDNMVLGQLETSLTEKVAELAARLEAGAPAAATRAAATEAAKGNLEVTTAKQQAAAAELSAAQEKQQEAAIAVEAAKAAIEAAGPAKAKAEQARDERQGELEFFQGVNMAAYNELKDKVSAKKQKELDAAASEAVREAAAEAAAEIASKAPIEAPMTVEAAAVSGA